MIFFKLAYLSRITMRHQQGLTLDRWEQIPKQRGLSLPNRKTIMSKLIHKAPNTPASCCF